METETKECPEAGMDIKEELPVELLHPSNRSRFTVVVNRDGLLDRRWSRCTIAWCDIKAIERIRGAQRIIVTLHNPARYISSMPLFMRLFWRLKNILNIKSFCLSTVALDIRTKELNAVIHRFWNRYRGGISRYSHPGSGAC